MENTPSNISVRYNYIALILCAVPAMLYFNVVNRYAINIPYHDDYVAILKFLTTYKSATGIHKFTLLFQQHNEHRILASRILYVIYYKLFGVINFRSIIFLGNIQLIAIFLIMLRFTMRSLPGRWHIPAIVLSMCVFDLTGYNNTMWAMASVQNFGVVALFLVSLYLYQKQQRWALPVAVLFQGLAVFSSGSGFLGSVMLITFCLLRRNKLKTIVATVASALFISIYFYHYRTGLGDGTGMNSVLMIVKNYFHFLSAHIVVGRRNYYDYIVYLLSIIILCWLLISLPFKKGFKLIERSEPLTAVCLFMMAAMGLISLVRWVGVVSGKYMIYPHLFIATVFILFMVRYSDSRYRKIALNVSWGFLVLMIACFYRNYNVGVTGCVQIREMIIRHDTLYYDPSHEKGIEQDACRAGIYCIENEASKVDKNIK